MNVTSVDLLLITLCNVLITRVVFSFSPSFRTFQSKASLRSVVLSSNSGNFAFDDNDDQIDRSEQPFLNEDSLLHLSLQRAKSELLGAPLPRHVSKELAKPAEKAFLEAMREVSQEFNLLKEEMGSDAAVDAFLRKVDDDDDDRIPEDFSVFE
jgi:hypothetical protein